jgi:predicted nucleic acid-binding protein
MCLERSVPNQIFVDTLFVIALINRRDQYHQQASELTDRFEGHPLLTTDAVLLEIGNALARNYKKEAVEIIEHFFTSDEVEIVHLTPKLFGQAFELYRAYHDKEWGMVDCISFVVMRERNIDQALTFDRHFAQAGFQVLMREELAHT